MPIRLRYVWPLVAVALAACSATTVHTAPALLTSSTDLIDFGAQVTGSTTQRTLFFLDKGDRPVKLADPKGDSLGGVFSVLLTKTSIDPLGDVVVRVVFTPPSVQSYTTTFTFGNDSENEPAFQVTLKGSGVKGDPCAGVSCNAPPPSVCLDAQKARHFNPVGTCGGGNCSYAPSDETCANGCDNSKGACAEQPCQGVTCVQPPRPVCADANTSRNYDPSGTCANGGCHYSPIDTSCLHGCDGASGLCAGDSCIGVQCTMPPPATCASATISRGYLGQGNCANGQCSYPPVDVTCPSGCDAATGACASSACDGVTCQTPPDPVCADANTSRGFNPAGTCAMGTCSYAPLDVACPNGCDQASGLCAGDPCIGVDCTTPPDPQCLTPDKLRTFNGQGRCAHGQCAYDPVDTGCTYGCDASANACAPDPCIGVTCTDPPNGCFFAQGKCDKGGCVYSVSDGVSCDDGDPCTDGDACRQGVCSGTPKTCAKPTMDACLDATTLVKYQAAGTCDPAGVCEYPQSSVTCDFGCENGACKGNPCAGGCDDGNPCTTDTCDATGCHHAYADGDSCTTGSGDCPQGVCNSGRCNVDPTQTCVAKIQQDLCGEQDVPGVCASNGKCVVAQPPPGFQCPQCGANALCIQCTPIPGIQLTFCL